MQANNAGGKGCHELGRITIGESGNIYHSDTERNQCLHREPGGGRPEVRSEVGPGGKGLGLLGRVQRETSGREVGFKSLKTGHKRKEEMSLIAE